LRLWATLIAAIAAVILIGCTPVSEPAPQLLRTVTIAGKDRGLGEPFGILRHEGKTYISDGEGGRILKIDDSGAVTVAADGLDTPSGIAAGPNGEIFIADTGSHTIKRLSPDGKLRNVAGVEGSAGSEDGAATEARFRGPIGIAAAEDGTIFVADTYNDRIRRISPEGQVTTLAGGMRGYADGTGDLAMFDTPLGIAVWHDKLLVADSGNRALRVVEPDGRVWTLVGGPARERHAGRFARFRNSFQSDGGRCRPERRHLYSRRKCHPRHRPPDVPLS
jgi:sugar lactone lactonase YvrE